MTDEAGTGKAVIGARVARVLGAGDAKAIEIIASWLALVRSWNARIDLTAARSDDELVDLMVADAAELAPRLPRLAGGARVVDVGTGAGAPGLALAALRPDLRVTLVEPLQKRVAFLRTVVGSVFPASARPEVVRGRGEDLVGKAPFAVAVSRATLAPPAWLALAPAGDVWEARTRKPRRRW